MKLPGNLLRLGLALAAACALPSCVVYDDGYGYDGGGYAYDDAYYDGYWDEYDEGFYRYRPAYASYGFWAPAHSYYYGGHYYSHPWWHDDHYRRYKHDRDAHRARKGGESLKLVRYRQDGRDRNLPSGYHSRDWYKSRGYSLTQNTYRDRDGDLHGRQTRSGASDSRSSSSRSSSSRSSADRSRSVRSSASHRSASDRGDSSRASASRASSSRSSRDHASANRPAAFSRYSHPSNSGSRGAGRGDSRGDRSSSGRSDDRHGRKK